MLIAPRPIAPTQARDFKTTEVLGEDPIPSVFVANAPTKPELTLLTSPEPVVLPVSRFRHGIGRQGCARFLQGANPKVPEFTFSFGTMT